VADRRRGRTADRAHPGRQRLPAVVPARVPAHPHQVRPRRPRQPAAQRHPPRRPPGADRPADRAGPVRLDHPQRRDAAARDLPPRPRTGRRGGQPDDEPGAPEERRAARAGRRRDGGGRPPRGAPRRCPGDLRDRLLRRSPQGRDASVEVDERRSRQRNHPRRKRLGRRRGGDPAPRARRGRAPSRSRGSSATS
jgi:hypothetical protein